MTLMMISAQVVETSVNVTNNSPSQDYSNPDDQTTQTTETPGFKPFTVRHLESEIYYRVIKHDLQTSMLCFWLKFKYPQEGEHSFSHLFGIFITEVHFMLLE